MVGSPRADKIRASYLSERLYHFFARGGPDDGSQAVAVFRSIVENGLVLTIGNQLSAADMFTFATTSGPVDVRLEQVARVCFTDIPEDKLGVHSEVAGYGRFGIGFSRSTIVSWGGSPVWYLPNTRTGALTDTAGVMLQYLRFGCDALKVLQLLYQTPACQPTLNFSDGAVLQPSDVINRSELAVGCIARALSFVKEMSPAGASGSEFQYLYEREWRIVAGVTINGKHVFKPLPDVLRSDLLDGRKDWVPAIEVWPPQHSHSIFYSPYDRPLSPL